MARAAGQLGHGTPVTPYDTMDTPAGYPTDAAAVTPSDTTAVAFIGLYIGSTGNVAVVTKVGTTVTFVGVPTGAILPINVTKVNSTNTTATSIVGFIA